MLGSYCGRAVEQSHCWALGPAHGHAVEHSPADPGEGEKELILHGHSVNVRPRAGLPTSASDDALEAACGGGGSAGDLAVHARAGELAVAPVPPALGRSSAPPSGPAPHPCWLRAGSAG